jgi:thiamine biosynthesis lipoprotein
MQSSQTSQLMFEQTSFTMGTYVHLQLYGDGAEKAVQAGMTELDRLTGVFDRFQVDSELSKLNAQAGKGWFRASADIWSALQTALDIAKESDGAYDPTVAPLVDLWGFREVEGGIPTHAPPTKAQISATAENVSYQQVEVDVVQHRVKLPTGVQIDLGGVAKGYALDRLADIAAAYGVKSGLIDLGGNLRVIGEKSANIPWRIAVRHPRRSQDIFATMPVREKSVSTSGDYQRYYIWEGRRYSHIIDPRDGQPARELVSVTVVAPTGALSDALSTAVFVLGEKKGKELLARLPGCEGLFIDQKMRMTVTQGLTGIVERSR